MLAVMDPDAAPRQPTFPEAAPAACSDQMIATTSHKQEKFPLHGF
jgi:hypothetical protein